MSKAQIYGYAAIAAALAILLGIWGGFAIAGLTPVMPFIGKIDALTLVAISALTAAGVTHVKSKAKQDVNPAPAAPAVTSSLGTVADMSTGPRLP